MHLTIVYHLYRGYEHSAKSLESILKQTDKNFELIFVADSIDKKVKKVFKDIDFYKDFANARFVSMSTYVGHSYSYNYVTKITKTPYIYFASGSCVYEPDFVKKINQEIEQNNPDFIVLDGNGKRHDQDLKYLKKDNYLDYLYVLLDSSHLNKVLKINFLNKNKIHWVNFKHYPAVYLFELYRSAKKIGLINDKLFSHHISKNPTFNVGDLVYQFEYLNENFENDSFYQKHFDQIQYLFIRTLTFSYLEKIYWRWLSVKHDHFKSAVEFVVNYLEENLADWKANKILNSSTNVDSKKLIDYIKNFANTRKTINTFLTLVDNGEKK